MKYLLILVLFLTACDNCDKPTKKVCIREETEIIMAYNAALKMMFPTTVSRCVEYKEVPNECYRGEKDDKVAR